MHAARPAGVCTRGWAVGADAGTQAGVRVGQRETVAGRMGVRARGTKAAYGLAFGKRGGRGGVGRGRVGRGQGYVRAGVRAAEGCCRGLP